MSDGRSQPGLLAAQLTDLVWHHQLLPQHVTVHLASTTHLTALGWIHREDDDQTGAVGLLSRVVAHRFGVHHTEIVLHPAVGHIDPDLARPASAEPSNIADTAKQPARVWTSRSRCGPLVIVATAQTPIGVDIEIMQTPRQAAELLTLLHPADQRAVASLSRAQRTSEVTAAWTRKEALLKGLGTGLQRDPALDPVGLQHKPIQPAGWASLSTSFAAGGGHYALGLAWRHES